MSVWSRVHQGGAQGGGGRMNKKAKYYSEGKTNIGKAKDYTEKDIEEWLEDELRRV